jgi:hypothetical protein
MHADDVRPQFTALAEEYKDAAAKLAAETKRRDALRVVLQGYVKLFPEFETLLPSDLRPQFIVAQALQRVESRNPRGQEAIRRVMAETPDQRWTVPAMVKELTHRGWLPESDNPAAPVRTAMERLYQTKQVRKAVGKVDGRVFFQWRTPATEGDT